MSPAPCLRVTDLTRRYGAVRALNGVALEVQSGERRAIIGPNGAGKTTLFNLIDGQDVPTAGRVYFLGDDVTALAPEARVRRGIGRTFQRTELFLNLTPRQSVILAVQQRAGKAHQPFRSRLGERLIRDRVERILDAAGLIPWADVPAGALSYGTQRKLDVALAIATEPRLLLLDEPTAGLSPAETGVMQGLLQSLPQHLTLVIIEHDMDVVFAIADRVTVLSGGTVLADGSPSVIRSDPRVRQIYLGSGIR